MDLRSDFEKTTYIEKILEMIIKEIPWMFECTMVATKAIETASARILALEKQGFALRKEKLIGHDGKTYGDYYVMQVSQQEKLGLPRSI